LTDHGILCIVIHRWGAGIKVPKVISGTGVQAYISPRSDFHAVVMLIYVVARSDLIKLTNGEGIKEAYASSCVNPLHPPNDLKPSPSIATIHFSLILTSCG
jgi:hypothetical protein